jgi:hypothetical protein
MTQKARAADLDVADSMFQAATTIATELGLQPLLAHCHLGFGDLCERRDRQADARVHRERGGRLLTELGMNAWFV